MNESGPYVSITASQNTTYTLSVFLKYGNTPTIRLRDFDGGTNPGHHVIFNLLTQTFNSALNLDDYGYIPYPNGWYRVWMTFTTGSYTNLSLQVRSASEVSGDETFYAWGGQIEAGAFPTSYIPTSGGTATRNHDRVYYENVDQTEWFNKTEGTVVFEHTDVPYNSSTPVGYPAVGFARTSDGTSASSIQYYFTKNYGAAQYLVRITPGNDSANINPPGGTGSAAAASKVGFVYKADDYALVRNGSLVGTDTSGAVPDAYMLIFGMNGVTNTTNNWNAHIKHFSYYPTRLTNTQLQTLTK